MGKSVHIIYVTIYLPANLVRCAISSSSTASKPGILFGSIVCLHHIANVNNQFIRIQQLCIKMAHVSIWAVNQNGIAGVQWEIVNVKIFKEILPPLKKVWKSAYVGITKAITDVKLINLVLFCRSTIKPYYQSWMIATHFWTVSPLGTSISADIYHALKLMSWHANPVPTYCPT